MYSACCKTTLLQIFLCLSRWRNKSTQKRWKQNFLILLLLFLSPIPQQLVSAILGSLSSVIVESQVQTITARESLGKQALLRKRHSRKKAAQLSLCNSCTTDFIDIPDNIKRELTAFSTLPYVRVSSTIKAIQEAWVGIILAGFWITHVNLCRDRQDSLGYARLAWKKYPYKYFNFGWRVWERVTSFSEDPPPCNHQFHSAVLCSLKRHAEALGQVSQALKGWRHVLSISPLQGSAKLCVYLFLQTFFLILHSSRSINGMESWLTPNSRTYGFAHTR